MCFYRWIRIAGRKYDGKDGSYVKRNSVAFSQIDGGQFGFVEHIYKRLKDQFYTRDKSPDKQMVVLDDSIQGDS